MSEKTDAEWHKALEVLKLHVQQLSEHFETVQIFTTRRIDETDSTTRWEHGFGNYYARYGHVHQWATDQDEVFKTEARKRTDNDGS